MALVVFRDNRWIGDQAILATMEIDLTRGSQMRNGEENLLITRGMVGRLSNTPNVGFAYEVQGVVNYLTSHGVHALPGRRYSTTPLQGLDWVIRPTQICLPLQPMEVNSCNRMDGRVSISFSNYTAARDYRPPYFNNNDEEPQTNEGEIIVVLTEKHPGIDVCLGYKDDPYEIPIAADKEDYPFILVHRLTSTAIMLTRTTPGAAVFDLAVDATM
ncbi:hypothetical protein ZIOFF_003662 [Zingiber officinale]|uniref:Uncharacterized protein n=1 Tax=Zingiber officinale TaxID=94328 RepID=A0A8J5IU24_ZINOF|nr:hypothetical protein ZIOFF_003662 [Zingiber officinale]